MFDVSSAVIAALVCAVVFVGILLVLRRRWRRDRDALIERNALDGAAHEQRLADTVTSYTAQIENTTASLSADLARERNAVEQERHTVAQLRGFSRRAIG